ncbi:hypothetical protein BDY21DRAFT_211208 [Lineolata rhizophorae]|uniref:Uncharacterized protein n=1 Tax=Lineolata rhizophorae TaxID=578093 RepID=A0A6A6P4N9_9PEZI|nr:hypothetical protein BDY21DRAFT_211208 [Lineolata rhizophorae]
MPSYLPPGTPPPPPLLAAAYPPSPYGGSRSASRSSAHTNSSAASPKHARAAGPAVMMYPDLQPSCAVCGAANMPGYPECPHESESLQKAVEMAEERVFRSRQLQEIRDWVVHKSREYVLRKYNQAVATRKAQQAEYLHRLPCYGLYVQYQGQPPLQPAALLQLKAQMADADARLRRAVDDDWRACCLQYPEVLDHFYSLVEWRVPNDRASSVVEPSLGSEGRERDRDRDRERKARRQRESRVPAAAMLDRDGAQTVPPERLARPPPGRRRDSGQQGRIKAPPVAPTPPVQHQAYGGAGGASPGNWNYFGGFI